ncbi:hypothetical protein [uncultured Sphingomonas sp.]|uniref:hypothetical protein n=1 Tax=uncultured Sphingomonas sp. TaxID=158754 RepID=UPI0025E35E07|nr:hypothetical protein [uncultured Sphingomonas sp.]
MKCAALMRCLIAPLALSACNPPTAQPLALFRNVEKPEAWDDEISTAYPRVRDIPPFVRNAGHIYLLVQVTQARALSTEVVFQEPITRSRIKSLKLQHPELGSLLVHAVPEEDRGP